MKTVYFHIGTMKTATTALQEFLPYNADILAKHGFCYPLMSFGLPGKYVNRNAHFSHYRSQEKSKVAKRKEEEYYWRTGFDLIKQMARDFDNIILSDEILWYRQKKKGFWQSVKNELNAIGCELKVIVYFRRQDEYLESYWNQSIKGEPRISMPFDEWFAKKEWKFIEPDYGNMLKRMEKWLGGRDNIIVRVFEREQFEGSDRSIYSDFLEAVGLHFEDGFSIQDSFSNERLPGNFLEIKRRINDMPGYRDTDNFYLQGLYHAAESSFTDDSAAGDSFFALENRRDFVRQFEESNAYVAREYLGREDGCLFYKEPTEKKLWSMDEDAFRRDMLLALIGADISLMEKINLTNERIDRVHERIDSIANILPARIIRKIWRKK